MEQRADPTYPGGLQTIAEREAVLLAPYAMYSADSRGRVHPEPDHPYRGPFQRDRDRIVHSAAYRRLSGKMQVFTGDRGDYHRTRLTHTQEVASIARTIGRALRLNEDLIEALALLHDIGHPPFGHAGEDALDECLAAEGGFSHNRQALHLVESLEQRYPDFPGLNLTYEVLQGQASRIDKQASGERPLLEVQAVEVSDSITYSSHDVDDAVKLKLVTLEELQDIALCRECAADVHHRYGDLAGKPLRRALVHRLIERQVNDVLDQAIADLNSHERLSADAMHRYVRIEKSPELTALTEQLQGFLYQRVYRHPELVQVRQAAQQRLRSMFQGYLRRPELLPERFRRRAEDVGLRRAVGDYLSGMTDRYCDDQYNRYFAEKPTS